MNEPPQRRACINCRLYRAGRCSRLGRAARWYWSCRGYISRGRPRPLEAVLDAAAWIRRERPVSVPLLVFGVTATLIAWATLGGAS